MLAAAAALCLCAGPLRAAQLEAGTGREDITPPAGFRHWATKAATFDRALSPLYARAAVVSDATRKIVFLQWDLVNTREDAVARVRGLISRAIGVPPGSILVNASHDHSAPLAPVADERLVSINEDESAPAPDEAVNRQWVERLYAASVEAARAANESLRPVTLEVSRALVPEWQYNRRPRRPDGTVESIFVPSDPYAMPEGMRFGPMDPTVTVLAFKDLQGRCVVTLFNYPCHAVSVYPYTNAASADWPGFAEDSVEAQVGGRAIFLQGCAGDLVPARRGVEAARDMGAVLGTRVAAAVKAGLRVDVDRLQEASSTVGLPWNAAQREKTGTDLDLAEVQVFTLGTVAVVALPGEPMIEIAKAIQGQSPYPHTLVLGYSNGGGVIYVGMPGELARGGYEATRDASHGTDDCGTLLVNTALRLLHDVATRKDAP
jgi:neutral ceramidase